MASGYYRFPTIQEETVVFVCEDDLWTVPVGGGIARRLTSNLGEVSHPYLSPDGEQIAFVGRDEGHAEIYLMPAQGGEAQRLTYMGGTLVNTAGWTPDGEIIFINNAEHWYMRFTQLYTMHPSDNQPAKLPYGHARAIDFGPNGGIVLGRNTDDPARWKRYRGGTAGQIWVSPDGKGEFTRILKDLKANLTSPMWIAEGEEPGRIFFLSDHEGIGNLYSCQPDGEDIQRHTDHEDFYIRNARTDGKHIVYHAGADLHAYHLETQKRSRIEVEFHSPQVQRKRKYVSSSNYLESWRLHPEGHSLVVGTRGQVFSFANWEGAVTGPLQTGPFNAETAIRTRLAAYLNDGRRIIAVTDKGGEESFVILDSKGIDEPVFLEGLDTGRPVNLEVNPKKDQIVFSNHRYEVLVLDLEKKELKKIDKSLAFPVMGISWSPDGEWVAYSVSISLHKMAVKLWSSTSDESTILAEPVLRDVKPSFDPQGKYLYFLSYRQFDPVYDSLQFDLGFPYGMRPYLVTLQKDLPSPFIPRLDVKKDVKEETGDDKGKKGKEESEDQPEDSGEEAFRIDLEGIADRVLAFPVTDGYYGRMMGSKDGKPVYSRFPVEGVLGDNTFDTSPQAKGSLYYYNFEEQKEESLTGSISDFRIGRNGETLIYRSKNNLRVLKAGDKPENNDGQKPSKKSGWVNLNRVKVSINPVAEWRQMFREAWRLQRDNFWTEDMSKVDWIAVHDRYLPLVNRVASRSEFSDLLWEMQGELGTSHAYEIGGDYRQGPFYGLGFLGARLKFDETSSAWEITEILQGDSWDETADSPLNASGVNIQVGDKIAAINGIQLNQELHPLSLLTNLAGQEINLTLLGEEADHPRIVTVRTLRSEIMVMYRQWVNTNRNIVHEATGGRVGYIHIPDMGGFGYSEFHRGYLAEVDREALIVDERFNRGGHVSSLLLEKLARKRIGYAVNRWGEIPEPYPEESVAGPMVTMINEWAGSDGDIFAHSFKLMGLGPVIGTRTWGGVIGIWPKHLLVDGTITTQPEYSFWFKDVGWGVENYGTDPDIEVDITPQDYTAGQDPQLDRALEEIVKALEENPPMRPDFSDRADLSLPRLPKE